MKVKKYLRGEGANLEVLKFVKTSKLAFRLTLVLVSFSFR